jgi:general secretion pathway protein G
VEKKRSGEAGFTLVELIVVIAILAILAGIVVFAVSGVQDKGSTAANKTTCSVLQTAEEAYYANNSSYAIGATAQDTLKTAGFLHTSNPAFSIVAPVAPDVGYTITGPNGNC